jgi:hypothetical protein
MNVVDSRADAILYDDAGTVFLEFLVAFLPIWTFTLGVFQLALIARAHLIVIHSADAAARSASVVLPDDPAEYGGEPEMSVDRNTVSIDDLIAAVDRISNSTRTSGAITDAFSGRVLGDVGRSRLNTIRLAAHVPLMPLAPLNVGKDRRPTLRKAIGGPRSLASSFYYQPFAVVVSFPHAVDGVVTGPEVTVRVTYAYQCTVPLARQILCDSFETLSRRGGWQQAFLALAQGFVGGRFRRLQHETTVLVQDAPYAYQPRRS